MRDSASEFVYGSRLGTIPFEIVFGDRWARLSETTKNSLHLTMRRVWECIDPFYKTAEVMGFVEAALTTGNENELLPMMDYVMEMANNTQKLKLGEIFLVVRCLLRIKQMMKANTTTGEWIINRAISHLSQMLSFCKNGVSF